MSISALSSNLIADLSQQYQQNPSPEAHHDPAHPHAGAGKGVLAIWPPGNRHR